MSGTEKNPAARIVEFMNRIYYAGLTTVSGGNLSILDADGTVWISPSGVDKGSLTEADIMAVTAAGRVIGRHKPSVEYPFHRAIYRRRPDFGAILHAHPPLLVAFSVAAKIPDTALVPALAEICGKISYAPYAVPGSKRLGESIAAEFAKGSDLVMMENHGVVLGADTMPHAFRQFEALNCAAAIEYQARLLGTPAAPDAAGRNAILKDGRPVAGTPGVKPAAAALPAAAEMAAFAARLCRRGLFRAGAGTIALRLDADRFLITPADYDRAALDPATVALVAKGEVEAGKVAPGDVRFATEVFAARPGVRALLFAQPPAIMAYGCAGVEFEPRVIPESYLVLRDAPAFAPGGRKSAAAQLSERDPVVLLRHDVAVTSGATLLQAFDRLEVLEYSAAATTAARALGGLKPMNDAQVGEIIAEFKLIP
jgi:L-fuculose-phosphate aldolase